MFYLKDKFSSGWKVLHVLLLLANVLLAPFLFFAVLTIGKEQSRLMGVILLLGCTVPMIVVVLCHLIHFEFSHRAGVMVKSLTVSFLKHRLMFLVVMTVTISCRGSVDLIVEACAFWSLIYLY